MLSFRVELQPTKSQIVCLWKHTGAARWAYNWGLNRRIEEYEKSGNCLTSIDLNKEIVKMKKTEEYSWLRETSKDAPYGALRNLDVAFRRFFKNCKTGEKKKGFPKFKSKHAPKQSFYLQRPVHVFEKHIQLPRLGSIKLKERDYLPTEGRITSATVSCQADRWFVSVNYDLPEPKMTFNQTETVGIDLGLTHLATLSNGFKLENPRTLRKYEKRLKYLQKQVSRKKKGSNNRRKAILRLQKLWLRISNIRKDYIHKFTTTIAKRYKIVCIEDLAVQNMTKLRSVAKSLSDACLGEIFRQLEYKCRWYGSELVKADRFFPSSKLCSNCGNKKDELSLSDRVYDCFECGTSLDRDLNAAYNLRNLKTGNSSGLACGENALVFSVKQELNNFAILAGV